MSNENEYKLKDGYKSCLRKVVYNVKSITICCIQTGIPGFNPFFAHMKIQTMNVHCLLSCINGPCD